jgi:hypothetical protein
MPAKRDIDFNTKKAYGLKSVTLKDQDATPVGDLLLKDVDQVLRVRDSGDQADKSIAVSSVPDLPASKVTSGSFDLARIPTPLTGKDADSVDGVHLPATIASVLSDHDKAVHDALAINADLLDSLHAADFALSGHTHSQYFLIVDHTKAVHDALAINADQVDGHDLDQDVKVASQPTFGQLTVSRSDVSGNGVKIEIRDTAVDYLSFAVLSMRAGLGNEGGMFFGSLAALDAYGIVNGVTFGPGTDTQDIGFRVGAALGGLATGPAVIVKADGKVGLNQKDPSNALHVFMPNAVFNSFLGGISVYSSDLNATGIGGSIRFGGRTTGFPAGYPTAAIKGAFENNSDFKGFLAFATGLSDGTITEKMRLTAAGYLGINQPSPTDVLDVKGFIKVGGGSGLRFSDGSDVGKWHLQYGDGGLKLVETGIAEQHHFADGGKVGIKKISPAYTLDVGGDIHLTGDHVVPVKDAIPSDTPPVGTMRLVRLAANQNRIYVYTADGWQWFHFGGSGLQWWSDGVPYP